MNRYTPRPSTPRPGLTPLDGGYGGATYRQDNHVLRYCPSPSKEAHFLQLAQSRGVPVPQLLAQNSDHLVLQYLEGQNLQTWLETHQDTRPFQLLGQALTRLHSIPLPPEPHPDLVQAYLNGRAGQRLGPLRQQVQNLPAPTLSRTTLVHCDLNPKNLIYNDRGIHLIDWEFAMAGDPLIDLGNLFRFSEDYTPEQIQAFLDNYQHPLSPDWHRQAQLHDLVSLLDMLNSEEDRPQTHQTALDRIRRILGKT